MSMRIMLQGTASSVGKSLLAAALCRIFTQDGFRVAPFKSQNMALNSFVTLEGGEMGRAQAVQAEACGIEPTVDMNPILLKPSSERGSQVIVNGRAIGNMGVGEYNACKPQMRQVVMDAFNRLSAAYDVVVLEGAGSPAEINLREGDFVNMGMAEMAGAPVLLVGDIDRGGVFASLAGTMLLLREEERARVKGMLINKFRGDVKLLEPGLKMLEDIVRVPVLGVIPFIGHGVDDEDGETERFGASTRGDIDVAVVRLGYISNFTDFTALALEKGVGLRYVSAAEELGRPDAVLLPGSKNTMEDLAALMRGGMADAVIRYARSGGIVLGICGGYQMLGKRISDPLRVESAMGEMPGLGLLDMEVEFSGEKLTGQARARLEGSLLGAAGPMEVEGYEIHMGRNRLGPGARPFTAVGRRAGPDGYEADGVANREGNVMGTYLHGIFDNPNFLRAFVNMLRRRKGLAELAGPAPDYRAYRQRQYDRLAECVRESADIAAIYRILRGE